MALLQTVVRPGELQHAAASLVCGADLEGNLNWPEHAHVVRARTLARFEAHLDWSRPPGRARLGARIAVHDAREDGPSELIRLRRAQRQSADRQPESAREQIGDVHRRHEAQRVGEPRGCTLSAQPLTRPCMPGLDLT